MSLHEYAIGITVPPRNRATLDHAFHNLHPSEEVSIMLTTSTAEKLTNGDCEVSMVSWFLHFPHGGHDVVLSLRHC